jgi:hypothetical protein
MATADAPTRAKIKDAVIGLASQQTTGGKVWLTGSAILVWGEA